jgi:polypyrimidine tract-binding protein 1
MIQPGHLQRGSDELLSQTAVMAPAADNNNQDLATKKAKLDSNSVIGGVGEFSNIHFYSFIETKI